MTETALQLLEYLNEQDRPVRIIGRENDIASLEYNGYIRETQLMCYGITAYGKRFLLRSTRAPKLLPKAKQNRLKQITQAVATEVSKSIWKIFIGVAITVLGGYLLFRFGWN